jgi:hypothetical protein
MPFRFGSWDGEPVIFDAGSAWVLKDGGWASINGASPSMEARSLTEAAFRAKFPTLPPDPEPWEVTAAAISQRSKSAQPQ